MALGLAVICALFGPAFAGQPMHIVITSTNSKWLNVREVQAKDGATLHTATSASLSSTWSGLPASRAIDGDLGDDLAHTGQQGADEWLQITYPAGTNIGTIVVYNSRKVLSEHNAGRIEGMKIEVQEGATSVWESTFVGVHDEYTFQVVTTTTTTTSITETRTSSSTTSSSSSLTSTASSTSTSTSSRTSTSTSSTLSTSSSSSSTLSSSSSSSSTSSSSSSSSTLTSSTSTSTTRTPSTTTSSSSSLTNTASSTSTSSRTSASTSSTLSTSTPSSDTLSSSSSSSSYSNSYSSTLTRATSTSTTSTSSTNAFSTSSSSKISSYSSTSSSSMSSRTSMSRSSTSKDNSSSTWSSSSTSSSSSSISSSSSMISSSFWSSSRSGTSSSKDTTTTTTTTATTMTTLTRSSTSTTMDTAMGTRTITSTTGTRTITSTTGTSTASMTTTSTFQIQGRPLPPPSSSSTSTSTTPRAGVSSSTQHAASVVAEAAKEAGKAAVAKLKEQGLTKIEVESDVGKVIIFDLKAALANSSSTTIAGEEGSAVVVSQELLESLPGAARISMIKIAQGEESTLASVETESGTEVGASTIMDLSVYDANGQYVPTVLEKPLLFRLPGSEGLPSSVQCKYLDTAGGSPRWSSEGVWQATASEVLASGQEAAGVWCWTLHLSVFAVILDVVLGCTNLELLSGDAMSAIVHHDGWETAVSAIAVFFITGVLLACFIIGQVRERWAFRLGSTKIAGKRVKCCDCLQVGPQILKHKYTAFIVYARDVMICLRAGHASRHELKSSSLTGALQRFLSVESGISTACISQHLWNGNGWADSKASIPTTVLCAKLEFHSFFVEDLIKRLCGKGVWPCFRRFMLTLLALHPLLDAMRVGAGSMTCGKRMLLQLCGVFGVLASNALIFGFSGSARSWEADAKCPIPRTSHFFFVVASSISILVNVLPNKWLMDLAKQVHGRPVWNLVFWTAASSHLAAGVLLVLIALANLNAKDQIKWYRALEWAMLIKMVGMPTAQGLRHWLMLESFLYEDGKVEASRRFRVAMGLKHPHERELTEREGEMVENWASHAISCSELVHFASLLGKVAMPEFDLERSSSGEVMHTAVVPVCFREPGSLQDLSWSVEALSVSGLRQDLVAGNQPLRVRVMRLAKQLGSERLCREQHVSEEVKVLSCGGTCLCRCSFQATLGSLQHDEAIGFEVLQGHRSLGLACLPLEDLCGAKGWSGKLLLHCPEDDDAEGSVLQVPPEGAAQVPVPSRFQGLARIEVRAPHSPETDDEGNSLGDAEGGAFQLPPQAVQAPAPSVTGLQDLAWIDVRVLPLSFVETEPADVMVVHSKEGKFVNLVSAVVTDALGSHNDYEVVEKKLHAADFEGLQELLVKAGCTKKRYWIDMFAMDPAGLQEEGAAENPWHEKLLACLPATIRSLRRIACEHKVAAIRKGQEVLAMPVTQLVVMDRHFNLMHEDCALSEIVLARAMHMKQRLVLHPSHLQGHALGRELRKLATGLQDVDSMGGRPWAAAFLEDPEAVFAMVRDMVVEKVIELKSDGELTWQELAMTDIVATLGAVQSSSQVGQRQSGRRDGGLDDIEGDVGGD